MIKFRGFKYLWFLSVAVQPAWSLNPHPRIWLDPATKTTLVAKVAKSDADWVKLKQYADQALSYAIPTVTIVSATNSNPVTFTTSGPIPFNTCDKTQARCIWIGGATGNWAAINGLQATNNQSVTVASATTCSSNCTFTIPVDSTSFGPFAGQTIAIFSNNSKAATIQYDYEASGWFYTVAPMALAYQATGNVAYAKKAIAFLDYLNQVLNAGITAPLDIDSGYPTRYVPVLMGIIYDWCNDQLNYDGNGAARIAATIKSASVIRAYLQSNRPYQALPVPPDSNYAAGHLLGGAVMGYALLGDDPLAQTDIDWAAKNWATMMGPAFQMPIAGATGYTGSWAGGVMAGNHYDPAWTVPYYTLYVLTRATAGDANYISQGYLQAFASTLLYDVKPDNWSFRMDGIQTGSFQGVLTGRTPMLLTHVLAQYGNGTTDAALAGNLQYLLGHLGNSGNASVQTLVNDTADQFGYFFRTIFWSASRTAVSATSLPTARFAAGSYPRIFWRSDWTTSADWMMFYPAMQSMNASTGQLAGDTRVAGEIDINRGTDHLIVNAQNWFGTGNGTGGVGIYGGLYAANDLASTLFFYDGGNQGCQQTAAQWGGQAGGGVYPGDPLYKIGPNGSWVYSMGDITQAYVGNCTPANRTLRYWYRTVAAVGNGTYVVADRSLAKAAGYKTQVRWHFNALSTPTLSGSTVSQTVGSSNLFLTTVLPANPTLNLVSNGADHCNGTKGCSVNYREEVGDSAGGASMSVLTVINANSSTASQPPVTSLSSLGVIDANHQGVQVADTVPKVVVFGWDVLDNGNNTYTSKRYTTASFTSSHSGVGNYLIDGLSPGVYSISLNGATTLTNQIVGSDGTLTFSSASGRFSITQTGTAAPSCDLNSDGFIDILDVQIAVNIALGTRACPAPFVISPGSCSLTSNSVPKVVTAALGGACILP
jgi:hypothetical protein